MTRINILGTPVDNLSMNETLDRIKHVIQQNGHVHHTVVNAGKIVAMHENPELRESVVNADIINADGQAVVWSARLLGQPLKERVAGIDLMHNLISMSYENGFKIFFFGAKEEVLKAMLEKISTTYSPDVIAGHRNGYFKKEEEAGIARSIADSGANILFVAITSPLKENFLYQNREVLKKVNFIMGVGGSFDVAAGLVKRAPRWMQVAGLEWLYRVYQEPKRMFKRYLVGNLKFIKLVWKYKTKKEKAYTQG